MWGDWNVKSARESQDNTDGLVTIEVHMKNQYGECNHNDGLHGTDNESIHGSRDIQSVEI